MAKIKKAWFCQSCGAQHAQWLGQCSSCHEWNTLVEEMLDRGDKEAIWSSHSPSKGIRARPISDIQPHDVTRQQTFDTELDRVLGGGLVPGSLTLLGGEPGVGKSTLLLKIALTLGSKVLYASGEESAQQIRLRADRLKFNGNGCHVLAEVSTSKILQAAEEVNPALIIVDSIQTAHCPQLDAAAGSVSQIRETASEFLRYAKSKHVAVILVGHITKDGQLAGPKVLEHMVDVVLQFEGDRHHLFRMLRAQKNRFGSTHELGIYEMDHTGLRAVTNPSGLLLSQRNQDSSGSAVGIVSEGMQPLLVEVQALVSSAVYGTPQRSCTGFDTRRLNMLLAVLEKRCGFRLGAKDVFLNVTGGLRIDDPAVDLAVCAAILSSNTDIPIPSGVAFAAEVGLGGEIRLVHRLEQRIHEAGKLGFDTVFCAKQSKPINLDEAGVSVVPVRNMEDLVRALFG